MPNSRLIPAAFICCHRGTVRLQREGKSKDCIIAQWYKGYSASEPGGDLFCFSDSLLDTVSSYIKYSNVSFYPLNTMSKTWT